MHGEILYLVFAISGDFSDRNEWIVCYRRTERDARAVRQQCLDEAAAFHAKFPTRESVFGPHGVGLREDARTAMQAMLDPGFDPTDPMEYVVMPIAADAGELARYNALRFRCRWRTLKEAQDQQRQEDEDGPVH